jgi:beta-glucosidase
MKGKFIFRYLRKQIVGLITDKYLIFFIFPLILSCGDNQSLPEQQIETRVQAILANMTLEQKVGQMIQAEIEYVTPEDVKTYYIGSVLNGGGSFPNESKYSPVGDWLALADAYYMASLDVSAGGAGIPIIWGTDAVHGHNNVFGATLFPHNIGLGAANDPDLINRIGVVIAREVAVTGIDWIFAPSLAVVKDYRWGRTYEGFSSETTIPADYAAEFIHGVQGDIGELAGDDQKVISTAKHFIGDGGTHRGIDQGDTRLSLDDLMAIHGQPYHRALQANVQVVMASFGSWNGKKIHGHKQLITAVLKENLGFDGIVVSDWNAIGQVEGCTNYSCPQSINAGVDMFMVAQDWKSFFHNTIEQVKNGEIPLSRIDDAVTRILRVKLRLGVYDKGLPSSRSLAGKASVLGAKEHRAVAREAVRKSLVLLKNRGQLLPLKGNQHVLVAGDGADNIGRQSGGWSLTWQGTQNTNDDFPGATSIYTALEQAISEIGGTVELNVQGEWSKKPDVAVVVFGEYPYAEGQGDTETLNYQSVAKLDLQLIQKLKQQNIPVVSVLLTGRPLWVNAELNSSDAFVVAWLPGSEGAGVADIMVADAKGKPRYDFTGRLAFNWPNADINAEDKQAPVVDNLLTVGAGLSYGADAIIADNLHQKPLFKPPEFSPIVFSGVSKGQWKMLAGDSLNWQQEVTNSSFITAQSGLKISVVDGISRQDSIAVEWSKEHPSQLFWQSSQSADITHFARQDKSIVMTYKIDRHPENTVIQRIDCHWPCSASQDVTDLFSKVPLNQWVKSAISLRCFEKAGANLSRVNTPLVLTTSGSFAITIKDVRIAKADSDIESYCN